MYTFPNRPPVKGPFIIIIPPLKLTSLGVCIQFQVSKIRLFISPYPLNFDNVRCHKWHKTLYSLELKMGRVCTYKLPKHFVLISMNGITLLIVLVKIGSVFVFCGMENICSICKKIMATYMTS